MKRIIAKNISKDFKIGFKKRQTTLERLTYLLSGKLSKKKLVALDNISFSIIFWSIDFRSLLAANLADDSTTPSIISAQVNSSVRLDN